MRRPDQTRFPAATWLMTLVGPGFTRGWVAPSATSARLELERPDGPPLTIIIDTSDGMRSPWPFASPDFAIGYAGAAADAAEQCRMLGARLAPHAGAVRAWVQAVRSASALANGTQSAQQADLPLPALDVARLLECARRAPPDRQLVEVVRDVLAREQDEALRACAAHLLLAAGEYGEAFRIVSRAAEPAEPLNAPLELLRAIVASMRGRDDEALRAAQKLLDVGPGPSASTTVAALLRTQGRHAEAVPFLERYVQESPPDERSQARVLLATARRDAGDTPARVGATLDGVSTSDPTLCCEQARVWLDIGRFDEAARCFGAALSLDPEHAHARLGLARMHLWRGETTHARDMARAFAQEPDGMRVLAGAAVLDGDTVSASAILEALFADHPKDREGRRWSAELHLRAGHWRAADRELQWLERQVHTIDFVLKALSLLARPVVRRLVPRLAARNPTLLDGFFHEQLPRLCTPAELASAGTADGLTALLWRLLRRFGGNRTDRPTVIERDDQGVASLLRAPSPESGRLASERNLRRLALEGVPKTLAAFDELESRFPKSPHPMVYRGELRLWLGDGEGALDEFRRSRARGATRWAYVGSAATLMFLGQPGKAWLVDRIGALRFKQLAAATTHVYRGELARRRGALGRARRELLIATNSRPTRVGAWINLALVEQRLGKSAPFEAALRRVAELAPAIVWEAHRAAGLPLSTRFDAANAASVLEKALMLMRGNRASTQHTLFVDGHLVVVPPAAVWSAYARLAASTLVPTLTAALFTRAQRVEPPAQS